MESALNINYFTIAQDEARNSIPHGFRAFVVNFFGKTQISFTEGIKNFFVNKLSKKFGVISIELEGIYSKLLNKSLDIVSIENDYMTMKNVVALLTQADELFQNVNYFDNSRFKAEIKNTLHISYQIEVELKDLFFQNRQKKNVKDEYFSILALKSKESFINRITNA
jgi:hypothetical protein